MTLVFVAFNVSMVVTVFAYALHATAEELHYVRDRPSLLIRSMVALFVLTPAAAVIVVEVFHLPLAVMVAIVALSFSIVPPLMPKQFLADDDEHRYAIGLTLVASVLSVVVIPAQVALLGDLTGHPYGIPVGEVAGVVVGLVLVPLAFGLLFRRIWPGAADRLSQPLTVIAGRVTLVALVVVMLAIIPSVWDYVTLGTIIAMVVFNVVAIGIGHLLGRPEREHSVVLGYCSPSRHPSIALTLAQWNYPGRNFTAAIVLLLVINGVIGPQYTKWMQRRGTGAALPTPTTEGA